MRAWFDFTGLSFPVGVENETVTVFGVLEQGRVLVVRGPSGSGKTTLLRVLARLHPCSGGDVRLNGRHWRSFTPTAWRTAVCYVAQQPAMFEGTVRDNLERPFQLSARTKRGRYNAAAAQEAMQELLLPAAVLEQDARLLSGWKRLAWPSSERYWPTRRYCCWMNPPRRWTGRLPPVFVTF